MGRILNGMIPMFCPVLERQMEESLGNVRRRRIVLRRIIRVRRCTVVLIFCKYLLL